MEIVPFITTNNAHSYNPISGAFTFLVLNLEYFLMCRQYISNKYIDYAG